MGFLFSSEQKSTPPAATPAEHAEPAAGHDDEDTFRTMEMMAKTLRDVGADDQAAEVEAQIASLRKSLRKMDGDQAFSTVGVPPADSSQQPQLTPRDKEAYADMNQKIEEKSVIKNIGGAVL